MSFFFFFSGSPEKMSSKRDVSLPSLEFVPLFPRAFANVQRLSLPSFIPKKKALSCVFSASRRDHFSLFFPQQAVLADFLIL